MRNMEEEDWVGRRIRWGRIRWEEDWVRRRGKHKKVVDLCK